MGTFEDEEDEREVCDHCGGSGVVTEELDDDGDMEGESTCCVCSGSGYA